MQTQNLNIAKLLKLLYPVKDVLLAIRGDQEERQIQNLKP